MEIKEYLLQNGLDASIENINFQRRLFKGIAVITSIISIICCIMYSRACALNSAYEFQFEEKSKVINAQRADIEILTTANINLSK